MDDIKIFMVAGEPSGDLLGAQLIKALKVQTPHPLKLKGVGGDRMAEEGLNSLISLSDLSVMSFTDALLQLPKMLKYIRTLVHVIEKDKPDLVLTIDFPGFNFHLGKKVARLGIPVVHFVAPTVWAWKARRAEKISRFLTHLLTLFPFELPYFEKHGLATTWVGHPLVEMGLDQGDAVAFRKKYHIAAGAEILLFLPGSRPSELQRHIPIFLETALLLQKKFPSLHVVIPTLPSLLPFLKDKWGDSIPVSFILSDEDKKNAYKAARGALAASGTVTLELALANVPMVMTYKVSWLNKWIAKLFIKISHFCMINILLKREVVPELLQEKCNAPLLSSFLAKILENREMVQEQRQAFRELKSFLQSDKEMPSHKAADVLLKIIEQQPRFQKPLK